MIAEPYLLVLNIALCRYQGAYWADPLWRKDLEAHCVEIANLTIACPVRDDAPPAMWEKLSTTKIIVYPLPPMGRLSYLTWPYLTVRLWQAISHATIVHSGVAGWPFPLGWIAIPLARLRRRFVVLVVESAFWRIPPGVAASALAQCRARLTEAVNRRLARWCDISFFTTQSYRDTLLPESTASAHILPAVWVDAAQLTTLQHLAATAPAKGTTLLFAGRLTAGKGVGVLLDAIARSRVPVDIMGEGELRDMVLQAQTTDPALVKLLDPVDYGTAFSSVLDRYAALVVPTISDEQPRIIYDAFARGVPVLASATSGNQQIVDHDQTGLLFEPNNAAALADALLAARRDPMTLQRMGKIARGSMASRTHAAMHATRARAIANALASHTRAFS